MHQIEDGRLEECRKFLVLPGPPKTREELLEIVRDLTWAVEELQFRRLNEKLASKQMSPAEPPRPLLIFGNDEAILKYVDEKKVPGDLWKQATADVLVNILPRTVHAIKLEGTDEELWKQWEELCRTYDAKPEGLAGAGAWPRRIFAGCAAARKQLSHAPQFPLS